MPAKSEAQQKFMGMVYALQKGELKPDEVSAAVRKAAGSMKPDDAKDYASTKHKGIPTKVKEKDVKEAKSVSQTQQKYMEMVHAYQAGDITDKDLKGDNVQNTSKTISQTDADDFASTDRKGLPKRAPKKGKKTEEGVEEKLTNEGYGSIASDARGLSSGTLASLTGLRKYKDIEKVQNNFVKFSMKNKSKYKDWYSAWEVFWKQNKGMLEIKEIIRKIVKEVLNEEKLQTGKIYKLYNYPDEPNGLKVKIVGTDKYGYKFAAKGFYGGIGFDEIEKISGDKIYIK